MHCMGVRQCSVKGDRGSAFVSVLAEFAQIRDPRSPLIGSLVFWPPLPSSMYSSNEDSELLRFSPDIDSDLIGHVTRPQGVNQ